ncbi:MAG TPA: hypothetical protein VF803_02535, partial [Candidatus Paceibacterota bacterium]
MYKTNLQFSFVLASAVAVIAAALSLYANPGSVSRMSQNAYGQSTATSSSRADESAIAAQAPYYVKVIGQAIPHVYATTSASLYANAGGVPRAVSSGIEITQAGRGMLSSQGMLVPNLPIVSLASASGAGGAQMYSTSSDASFVVVSTSSILSVNV